uniref:Clathrin light chain n=1 Tax=Accipiter nisus TaxID=211598 RepID=A0A8B9NBG2_9AVES
MADDFGFFSSSEGAAAEEDPAAAFLAQQESEIAGIENDEGFGPADGESGTAPAGQAAPPEPAGFQNGGATVNGDVFQESNGPTDAYAAIAKADRLTQEPESIRKWREEQKKRLEELDAASKVTEQEWREKAKKDLEEWNLRQNEQMEKNRANNRYIRVSMAMRAVMGAAVQPHMPICLPGMTGGLFHHSGAQFCRDGALPGKGRGPRASKCSGGCAEPAWLEPHWDHSGILMPPLPPMWASHQGRVGALSVQPCHHWQVFLVMGML